jgi:hypothetical protein
MDLSSQFDDYLSAIRLTDKQREACIAAHQEVREKVASDPNLSKIVVATFLQGSYVRNTIIRPSKGDCPDVDVVVVTRLSKDEYTPSQAISQFNDFLQENYKGRHHVQGRSIGIKFPTVDLDLVVTAAPSESVIGIMKSKEAQKSQDLGFLFDMPQKEDQWKSEPLLIPDRDVGRWVPTFPLAQLEWTRQKNKATNGHFVNVVKAIKRWQDLNGDGKRPKGFLIERLVGEHCPDGIQSVAEGIEAVLRGIKDTYGPNARNGTVPVVTDTGIPSNNVFKRVSVEEFRDFYGRARVASAVATDAYNDPDPSSCRNKWCALLGKDFPSDSGGGGSNRGPGPVIGFPPPAKPAQVRPGRFA